MNKLLLKLDNLEDRDGCVMVTLQGPGAAGFARHHQAFCGDSWEADGDDFAYCMPLQADDIVKEAKELCGEQVYWDWKDPEEKEHKVHVALDLSDYC